MATKKSELDSIFEPLNAEPTYRLIWRSMGLDKTGKNHFGFTAPGPIFGQYFDPGGTEGVAEKFINGKDGLAKKEIRGKIYRWNKHDFTQDDAKALRDEFIEHYEIALHNARTIQWDETEVWALFRYAEFGDNEQGVSTDNPRNYTRLNTNYRDLLQRAYDENVNLQLIQKVKEKWGIGKSGNLGPLGTYKAVGFTDAGYIVQATLEHSFDESAGTFKVRVVNCRQNMTLAGTEYDNTNFAEIATLIYGEESEGAWD